MISFLLKECQSIISYLWTLCHKSLTLSHTHFHSRAQMFKGQMTLTSRSMAIQQINVNKIYSIIHRIEIYPLESVIHPSTNWYLGLVVQRVFSTIHSINLCLVDISIYKVYHAIDQTEFIHWIALSTLTTTRAWVVQSTVSQRPGA